MDDAKIRHDINNKIATIDACLGVIRIYMQQVESKKVALQETAADLRKVAEQIEALLAQL